MTKKAIQNQLKKHMKNVQMNVKLSIMEIIQESQRKKKTEEIKEKKRALTHTPHMYGVRNLQEFSTLKIKAFLLSLCLVQTPLFYNAQFY